MIPRLRIGVVTICTPLFEADGVIVSLFWLGFLFEVSVTRIPRG